MQKPNVKYELITLSTCSGSQCISGIIEVILSVLIIGWLAVEFVLHLRNRMRFPFSWQELMMVQTFLCLACMICLIGSVYICYSVWSTVNIWITLSIFFYHFYFTTLVYYVCKKNLEKKIKFEDRKPYTIALIIVYTILSLGQLGVFVYKVNEDKNCKELMEIIINGVMIGLGIVVFLVAYQNVAQERKRVMQFNEIHYIQNPLRTLCIWIGFNIFGQICNEIESVLIFDEMSSNECYFINNDLEDDILGPVFFVLTFGSSFCSTLWFYQDRRGHEDQLKRMPPSFLELVRTQTEEIGQNNIQIIRTETQSSNISDPFLS